MDTPPPPADDAVTARPRFPKPPAETLIGRALKLRCPRCGQGKLFNGWFTMPERCSHCGFKFERDPGYFLEAGIRPVGAIADVHQEVELDVRPFTEDRHRSFSLRDYWPIRAVRTCGGRGRPSPAQPAEPLVPAVAGPLADAEDHELGRA